MNGGCSKVLRVNGSESTVNFDSSSIKNSANKQNSSSSLEETKGKIIIHYLVWLLLRKTVFNSTD